MLWLGRAQEAVLHPGKVLAVAELLWGVPVGAVMRRGVAVKVTLRCGGFVWVVVWCGGRTGEVLPS